MKRKGNLFAQVCSMENLLLADSLARTGKGHNPGIREFDKNKMGNLSELRDMLLQKEFTTSQYSYKKIHDPKERDISILPYYPDRIVQRAAMIPVEEMLLACFTSDSYASIKGKGTHAASIALEKALRNVPGTQFCLKLDVKKFYDNIDHDILKQLIRRKIKDQDYLWLIDNIIDSAPGLPIGNFTSAFLANLYLNGLDHFIKESLRVKYYFRYMDDIIIPATSKAYLHWVLSEIRGFLADKLKLEIKHTYQVFPVEKRGIDAFGYVHFHTHKLLRKRTKKRFARAVASGKSIMTIASYYGLAIHANSNNLIKKLSYGNDQLQRLKHKTQNKGIHRAKHRGRRYIERRDCDCGLQDRPVKIQG